MHELDPTNLEQAALLSLLKESNDCLFLTGKAGTGKSTLLRYITEHTHKKHVVLASTGIAALNVGGQTIHSFFKLPLRPLPPDDPELSTAGSRIYHTLKYSREHRELIRSLELIIIDEVSMVRADVIDAIDRILRAYCRYRSLPFGGVQILFVGDLYQLEPVITGEERGILDRFYGTHFFFGAQVFRHTRAPITIELTKVYRQRDESFVDILDRVRCGRASQADIYALNQRYQPDYQPPEDELVITLGTKRRQVSAINEQKLSELKQPAHSFEGKLDGEFSESSLPTDKTLVLKEGAQVMLINNDRDRRWVNGTIGIVERIEPEEGHIYVRLDNGQIYLIEPNSWENVRYTYNEEERRIETEVIGSFLQYPLRLAWAITTHKSQGLTFDKVIIDFTDRAFASGQAYVALSRCRTLEGMYLRSPLSVRDAIVSPDVPRFYAYANNRAEIEASLERAEAQKGYIEACRQWSRGHYTEAIDSLGQAIAQSNELSQPTMRRLLTMKLQRVPQMQAEMQALRKQIAEQKELLQELAREHTLLGNECLSEVKDAAAALRCYDKALRLDKRSVEAMIGRARAHLELGAKELALSSIRYAQQLSPRSLEVCYYLGYILYRYRQHEGAIQPLLTAIEIDPKHKPSYRLLIEIYERLDMIEEADKVRKHLQNLDK